MMMLMHGTTVKKSLYIYIYIPLLCYTGINFYMCIKESKIFGGGVGVGVGGTEVTNFLFLKTS